MLKAFKTYAAIFGFLLDSSNTMMINGQKYSVPSGKRTFLKLISLLFVTLPGFISVITLKLDDLFELSMPAVIILFIVFYAVISVICGIIAEHTLCRNTLKTID